MKFSDITQVMKVNMNNMLENYARDFWVLNLRKGKENSFVVTYNNIIIGYILCDKEFIHSFAVETKYRNNNLGENLLLNCLNSLNNDIKLYCRVSNDKAINLYKKHEFYIKEELKNYYIYPKPEENAYIFEKKIINCNINYS